MSILFPFLKQLTKKIERNVSDLQIQCHENKLGACGGRHFCGTVYVSIYNPTVRSPHAPMPSAWPTYPSRRRGKNTEQLGHLTNARAYIAGRQPRRIIHIMFSALTISQSTVPTSPSPAPPPTPMCTLFLYKLITCGNSFNFLHLWKLINYL